MNKIKAILVSSMMVALASMVFAPTTLGNTETITVTLTPAATANITIDKSTWEPGCGIGETNQTATDWGTCMNDGSVAVNVTVNITADVGTVWTVSADATPGHDEPAFAIYDNEMPPADWELLSTTQSEFATNIAYDSEQTFGLNVSMPPSTSTNVDQTFTITFVATPYGS